MNLKNPAASFVKFVREERLFVLAFWCLFLLIGSGPGFSFKLKLNSLAVSALLFGVVIVAYWGEPLRKFVGAVLLFGVGYTLCVKLWVLARSVLFPHPNFLSDLSVLVSVFCFCAWVSSCPAVKKLYR